MFEGLKRGKEFNKLAKSYDMAFKVLEASEISNDESMLVCVAWIVKRLCEASFEKYMWPFSMKICIGSRRDLMFVPVIQVHSLVVNRLKKDMEDIAYSYILEIKDILAGNVPENLEDSMMRMEDIRELIP